MINNVSLTGRLTKDPELRYTPNGVAMTTLTLAVNRNFTNENGERDADFIQCVAWRTTAETIANHTKKGSLIGITGRIQTRNYEHEERGMVYVTEVIAEQMVFLEGKKEEQQEQKQPQKKTYQNNKNKTNNYSKR